MLDGNGAPAPGYWVAVLWKTLMGPRVLAVAQAVGAPDTVTVYAFAAPPSCPACTGAAVLNRGLEPATVQLNWTACTAPQQVYVVTAGPDDPAGKPTVAINDVVPEFAAGSARLPHWPAQAVPCGAPVQVPPLALAFVTTIA